MNDAGLMCQTKCPQAGTSWSPPVLTFTGALTSSGAKVPDPSKGTMTMTKAPTLSLVKSKIGSAFQIGAPSASAATTPTVTSDGTQVIVPAGGDVIATPAPAPDNIAPWQAHKTALVVGGVLALAAALGVIIVVTRKK